MTAEREDGTAGGHLRASHADRERAIDALKAAFTQGRLTKDEFSERAGQVFASRTYADLNALTSDISGEMISARPTSKQAGTLSPYEVAYLCGGPERVALTAIVTMRQDGRVRLSPARHRIVVARDEASHPVERAVLDSAPWPGTGLSFVRYAVAGSKAARSIGDELRRRGLLGRHSHLTAAGREMRDELQAEVPEDLRVAVLGTSGVESGLRMVLDAPDPPPASTLIPKRRAKPGRAGDELPVSTDVAGYPGVSGHW